MPSTVKTRPASDRATRANGDASRRRLLDVAAEVAGERGYAGTSISEVSKRSGLPNSSIYWHFENKDALFAAVIEDSYDRWRADLDARIAAIPPDGADVGDMIEHLHDSLLTVPEFQRFGQLIILEQRDLDLTARAKFVEIRRHALHDLRAAMLGLAGVDEATADLMAALALALLDGAALAHAAGESTLDGETLSAALRACVAAAGNRSAGAKR